MRLALLISQFNEDITQGLQSGAEAYLKAEDVPWEVFFVPGAFEMPLLAKQLAAKFDGVICLGAVIKGETAHFEYISEATAHGLMQVGLETGRPVTFGVLTTYNREQALARSQNDRHNKGREAAAACVKTLQTLGAITPRA